MVCRRKLLSLVVCLHIIYFLLRFFRNGIQTKIILSWSERRHRHIAAATRWISYGWFFFFFSFFPTISLRALLLTLNTILHHFRWKPAVTQRRIHRLIGLKIRIVLTEKKKKRLVHCTINNENAKRIYCFHQIRSIVIVVICRRFRWLHRKEGECLDAIGSTVIILPIVRFCRESFCFRTNQRVVSDDFSLAPAVQFYTELRRLEVFFTYKNVLEKRFFFFFFSTRYLCSILVGVRRNNNKRIRRRIYKMNSQTAVARHPIDGTT